MESQYALCFFRQERLRVSVVRVKSHSTNNLLSQKPQNLTFFKVVFMVGAELVVIMIHYCVVALQCFSLTSKKHSTYSYKSTDKNITTLYIGHVTPPENSKLECFIKSS